MTDHVYKLIELTGTSSTSTDDAIRNAIAKADQSLDNIEWFQVVETRGHVASAAIDHWQVTIKVGFRIKD